jgi:hypothetical protein
MTYTYHHLIRDLRMGKFTPIGSYPLFFLMATGETLCPNCVKVEVLRIGRATRDRDGQMYRVVGCDINWEDMNMECAECCDKIECAYPSDEVEAEDE